MEFNRNDIIALKTIASATDVVAIDTIPRAFKKEFQQYFFGKTLVEQKGQLFAYPHDVKNWVFIMFRKYNH